MYKSWCNWRYEDTEAEKPTKVPYDPRTGKMCSVNEPSTWCTYDETVAAIKKNPERYNGIGFVLSEKDPYSIIDLDKTTDPASLERQLKIYSEFDSYAERSPSGFGLHIVVRGKVPSGRRRSSIELYSDTRYMTFTGDIYRNQIIGDYNVLLNQLWEQMGEGKHAISFYAGLDVARYSDEKILEIAATAANAEKFDDLYYKGDWSKYYPSQSEADFALIDILAFYSENKQQVNDLFLKSKLGQRPKSRAPYRIAYMLNRCFDRMLPPVDIDSVINNINAAIAEKIKAKPPPSNKLIEKIPVYSLPPGLLGSIAEFIYAAAPRPVPEIALAGAVAFLSGICGRAYNVSGTGLNQYVILLAKTGIGKEAMASGIDKLMNAVVRTVPAAAEFIGPGTIASKEALIKYLCNTSPSFCSIVGEFGLALQQMSNKDAPSHLIGLRSVFLDLYHKSGYGNALRPIVYSEKEKNTPILFSPAFSLLGESTPETFYEALSESMISGGLLPRFLCFEYLGVRVALNKQHVNASPSFELAEKLATLCANCLSLNNQNKIVNVQLTEEVHSLFDKFETYCTQQINSTENDIVRDLWNRAHLKAMKLAALVAIGINFMTPLIDLFAANWAIGIVVNDVQNLLSRFNTGAIGSHTDESQQLDKLINVIREWVVRPYGELKGYLQGTDYTKMHNDKIVPFKFIQGRAAKLICFKSDRQGATAALHRTLKILTDRGDIQLIGRGETKSKYNEGGTAYAILIPRAFDL